MKTHHAPSIALAAVLAALAAVSCDDAGAPSTPEEPSIVPLTLPQHSAPALSGGTLLVTRDARWAIVADPDLDRVLVVDLETLAVRAIGLSPGDEPGRAVEDLEGNVHVALRGGGAVVSINPSTAGVLSRREVCGAPRGLAFDGLARELVVACAGGELVRLAAQPLSSEPPRAQYLEPDLRDVVMVGRETWVSHLRGSEVLRLDAAGNVLDRRGPEPVTHDSPTAGVVRRSPTTAWRMVAAPSGGVALTHQMGLTTPITSDTPGEAMSYDAENCNDVVSQSALTVIDDSGIQTYRGLTFSFASLPVDLAFSTNGERVATVDAGSHVILEQRVAVLDPEAPCDPTESTDLVSAIQGDVEEPVALAYGYRHDLWVQNRLPAELRRYRDGALIDTIPLGGDLEADEGYERFHTPVGNPFFGLSCASCHPEGRDDGHTWAFGGVEHRTQSLAGTVAGTAPYHWAGDLQDMEALMDEVFVRRMGGAHDQENVGAVAVWLANTEALRVSPLASDAAAVSRGETLFRSAETGCATCHSGAAFTNNQTLDVGTGEPLQVPSLLGVGMRGPWMHDGCAKTLRDRFDPACGGGDAHGITSQLTASQIDDLIAYLDTL